MPNPRANRSRSDAPRQLLLSASAPAPQRRSCSVPALLLRSGALAPQQRLFRAANARQRPCSAAAPRPAFQLAPHRRCHSKQHLPDGALPRLCPCSATAPQQAVLCADGSRPATAPPRRRLLPGDPPRRPGQQQTSSGGEKYCGLASNLAHLGRICKLAAVACDLSQHLFIYVPISLAAILDCCSDRRKSFGPSAPIAYATSVSPPNEAVAWPGCRCWVLDMAVVWPGAAFLQITARANPCSRHLWGTLARSVASI